MKYCQKCGMKIKQGTNFCEGCGKSLKQGKKHPSSKQRPTFLNVWLILMLVGNAFSLIFSFQIPYLIPFVILGFIFIIALYNWKRWGFYGYIASGVIGLFVNASIYGSGMAVFSLIGLIIGTLILYLAMKPVWDEFE